ncbi:hypothetical protein Q5P01_001359 [Channa striata]|uniref:Uncharacterized protein n=1 Tax=Channa striata TaxID=64152 RepID=A0AA88T2Q9_CHASR|nr:hypothetical protein Q5P01_001359 [Channa striata]
MKTMLGTWISPITRKTGETFRSLTNNRGKHNRPAANKEHHLICILAVIFPTSKGHEQEEMESPDGKATEQMKKPKGPAPPIRQKPKKESKKKR